MASSSSPSSSPSSSSSSSPSSPPQPAPKPSLDPARWAPPRDRGLTGPFAPTDAVHGLELWPVPGGGPEDIAVDVAGTVYTGVGDGSLLRITEEGRVIERVAHTGGRPLGVELAPDGTLVVSDCERGLLRVDPASGAVTVLVDSVDGRPLTFTNNASVAADGTIYFTESSSKFTLAHLKGDMLEHRGLGRLMRRGPDGAVDVLVTGLDFANGVALSADESHLVVAETGGYRVSRVWLTGERAGSRDVLLDNLPGFPDNISLGPSGLFWMPIVSERNALLDRLLPLPGALRKAIWALPDALQPDASRSLLVVGFDADGTVRVVLEGPGDRYHYVTGVREHDGWLYLGSLEEDAVARVRRPGA